MGGGEKLTGRYERQVEPHEEKTRAARNRWSSLYQVMSQFGNSIDKTHSFEFAVCNYFKLLTILVAVFTSLVGVELFDRRVAACRHWPPRQEHCLITLSWRSRLLR